MYSPWLHKATTNVNQTPLDYNIARIWRYHFSTAAQSTQLYMTYMYLCIYIYVPTLYTLVLKSSGATGFICIQPACRPLYWGGLTAMTALYLRLHSAHMVGWKLWWHSIYISTQRPYGGLRAMMALYLHLHSAHMVGWQLWWHYIYTSTLAPIWRVEKLLTWYYAHSFPCVLRATTMVLCRLLHLCVESMQLCPCLPPLQYPAALTLGGNPSAVPSPSSSAATRPRTMCWGTWSAT